MCKRLRKRSRKRLREVYLTNSVVVNSFIARFILTIVENFFSGLYLCRHLVGFEELLAAQVWAKGYWNANAAVCLLMCL